MWILAWRRTPTSPSLSTSRPGSRVAGRDTCDLWRLMCCLPRTRNLAQACPSVSAETSSTTPPFNRMRPLGGGGRGSSVLRPSPSCGACCPPGMCSRTHCSCFGWGIRCRRTRSKWWHSPPWTCTGKPLRDLATRYAEIWHLLVIAEERCKAMPARGV